MPYWDERFAAVAKDYPGFTTDQYLHRHPDPRISCATRIGSMSSSAPICSATSSFRSRPGGGRLDRHRALGQHQPRAPIPPQCSSRCTVSAPDIAGRGVANPIGQNLVAGAMMLEHFGEERRGTQSVERAIPAPGPRRWRHAHPRSRRQRRHQGSRRRGDGRQSASPSLSRQCRREPGFQISKDRGAQSANNGEKGREPCRRVTTRLPWLAAF